MARRMFPAGTSPASGASTGANSPATPAGASHALAVGKAAPSRKKKAARHKHHSKRRG